MTAMVRVWTARVRPVDPVRLPAPQRTAWLATAATQRDRYATGVLLQLAAYAAVGEQVSELGRWCPACGSDEHGKSVPAAPTTGHWSGSVSHAGEWAMFALVGGGDGFEVGMDIEQETPWSGTMAGLILAPTERDPGTPALQTRLWVRKEAVLKATGAGLLAAMPTVDVTAGIARFAAAEVPTTAIEVPTTAIEVPTTATEVPTTPIEVPMTAAEVPTTAIEVPLTATRRPIAVQDVAAPVGYAAAVAVLGADRVHVEQREMPL